MNFRESLQLVVRMMTRSLLSLLGSATILLGTTPLIQAQDSGVPDNATDPSAKNILARALERAAVCHTQSVHPPEQLCVDSRWCLDGHGRTRTAFVCAAAAPDSSVHRQWAILRALVPPLQIIY